MSELRVRLAPLVRHTSTLGKRFNAPLQNGRIPVCDLGGILFGSKALVPNQRWGRNLDAFNDILRGGFGTPSEGFTIRWKNHRISKQRLGYPETARQLELRLKRRHPDNRDKVSRDLEVARQQKGPTVFDWLVDIIRIHCKGALNRNCKDRERKVGFPETDFRPIPTFGKSRLSAVGITLAREG